MSTAELQKRVIAQIRQTKDNRLLRELDRMLKASTEEIAPYVTTPAQKKAIAKSRAALKKGDARTEAISNKAVLEWLGK